ncbi:glucan -beta-glucosidase [Phlyctema vagabunda]|uniref:Glucan -beta-glucosidase n=1 Tax=Phlyctema vagabunda TaxID=108571 RepID=A0ABR4P6B1_9HELO
MDGPHYRGSAMSGNSAQISAATTPMRPGTPESRVHNPFNEDAISPMPRANPFATPFTSRPASSFGSSSAVRAMPPQRYFHSRRVRKGEVDQPWKSKVDPKEKWVTIIPLIGLLLGFGIAGFLVYDGLSTVVHHKYCPIMSDDFSGGLNTDIWTKEAEVGGFGNGQFEQTTLDDENVYIENGKLVIKPTLQDATLLETNNVINLTSAGTCSSDVLSNCVTQTNVTAGTIIQPVKSGRINTKKGATVRYGRVQVTATIPEGDWLWPAIWMLPVKETYGPWPQSGEIDIMESRGNNHTYKQGGNNIISSALHWGPDPANDAWWRTNVKRSALHTTYAKTEHKFGLEWSQKYLFTWVDNNLLQVMYTNFDEPMWKRGGFQNFDSNGTKLVDIWSQTGRAQTPFDQEFYLIMNVGVGGTNGWFEDGASGKPWIDSSPQAKNQFWEARDQWYPTWQGEGKGQMTISKVEMWSQCDGNEDQ